MTHSHDTATPALSVESEYVLVPREPTPEMQRVYFTSIDANMHRVENDVKFGRYENMRIAYRAMIAAAPAPNPSPAAKGGEAVRPLKAIGEEAERYRASRGPEWCKIFDTLRDYRMSNMAWEDGEPGYPLVDLMSRVGDTVTIADGEWEMVALADEIGLALATPSPQPANAVREKLKQIIAKDRSGPELYEQRPDGVYQCIGNADGECAMIARSALAALASDPAPAGISTEDFLRGMARMSSYPVEICQKFEDLADLVTEHDNAAS